MRGKNFFDNLARKVGGKTPSTTVGRRAQRALLAERSIREVLELAVRVGETMLALGASATDVTDAIRRTTKAFGVDCQIDLTFTSILVVHDGVNDGAGISLLRVVNSRLPDYDRLTRVMELSREIAADPNDIDVAETIDDPAKLEEALNQLESFHQRLDEILVAPQRFRRSMVTLWLALMAGGVGFLLGGGPLVCLLSAATTVVVDLVLQALGRWGLPAFFLQIAGAAIATGVAVGLLAALPVLPVEFAALPPALVVASGLVVLLAGMSFVGAADDAINGFPITAMGRLLEVVLLTLGLIVGIAIVLDVARGLGIDLRLVERSVQPWPSAVQVIGAAIAAAAWALASYATMRTALVVMIFGGIAYLGYDVLVTAGTEPLVATAVPALIIGILGEGLSRKLHIPATITTVCGTVPLLPGLAIYQGMLDITSSDTSDDGVLRLVQAGSIGIGIAGGVTLGRFLARQFRTRRRRRTATPEAMVMSKRQFRGTASAGPETRALYMIPDEVAVGLETGMLRIVSVDEVVDAGQADAEAAAPPAPSARPHPNVALKRGDLSARGE
ncbi:threonine/serine exporter ThrE family protein [Pseudoclavibacter sp. JSM 162008]|uniref:threonine/serine ThrE exporter family protein n=1 Tax=Pseudoclavibacter sp. JSM 162008 TaxID=3229855 RepID=UPI0035259DD2